MEDTQESADELLSVVVKEEYDVQEEDVQFVKQEIRMAETLLDTSLDCHECGETHKTVQCLLRHLASRHGSLVTEISDSLTTTNLHSVTNIKEEQTDEVEETPDLKILSRSTKSIKPPLPGTKKFECDKCGTKLMYKRGFIRHYREIHLGLRNFKCNKCKKIYKRNSDLQTHLESHSNKSFECYECGRIYKTLLRLLCHLASSHSCLVTKISDSLSTSTSHSVNSTKNVQSDQVDESPDWKVSYVSAMSIETENKNFKCKDCGVILKYKRGFIRHYREVHLRMKNFKCQKCTKIYKRYPDLQNHMESHSYNSLKCYKCGSNYKDILSLLRHLGRRHKGFVTDILDSLYTPTPDSVTSSKKDQIYQVKQSPDFKITSESAKSIFKMLLQGDKKFECEKCGLKLMHKRNIIRHYKEVHLGMTNFKCQKCTKIFKRHSDFKKHLKSHSNESLSTTSFKEHQKDQVERSTVMKIPLGSKMSIKSSLPVSKKFECDKCGVKLMYKRGFIRHYREVHLGMKNFKCKQCNNIYKRNSELKRHLESHSNKWQSCEICKKPYKGPMSLKKHNKTHSAVAVVKKFECDKCGVILKSSRGLTNHYKEVHVGIKIFQCKLCNKIYKRNYQLKKHLESHLTNKRMK